jgi:hypothetical protein
MTGVPTAEARAILDLSREVGGRIRCGARCTTEHMGVGSRLTAESIGPSAIGPASTDGMMAIDVDGCSHGDIALLWLSHKSGTFLPFFEGGLTE